MRSFPSSKSLLSPGRCGTAPPPPPAPSLSSSRSRRHRNCSSTARGAQSPMFPSGGRRKGPAFEAAEPSSPKVTCIGQVRVRGGKRRAGKFPSGGAALRSKSRRSSSDASFRRGALDDGRSQESWVYQIPISICEALKAFGSCGMCSSSSKPRRNRGGVGEDKGASAAVSGEEILPGRGAPVGLVLQKWEESVLEPMEVAEDDKNTIEISALKDEQGVEEPRGSACVPPRNALLLMRCRSDPVRMASLATRFFGSPAASQVMLHDGEDLGEPKPHDEKGGGEEEKEVIGEEKLESCDKVISEEAEMDPKVVLEVKKDVVEESEVKQEQNADLVQKVLDLEKNGEKSCRKDGILDNDGKVKEAALAAKGTPGRKSVDGVAKGRRSCSSCSPSTGNAGRKSVDDRKCGMSRMRMRRNGLLQPREKELRRHSFSAEMEARRSSFSGSKEARRASFCIDRDGRRWSFSSEKGELVIEPKNPRESRKGNKVSPELEQTKAVTSIVEEEKKEESAKCMGNDELKHEQEDNHADRKMKVEKEPEKPGELPDCLLLMMYEPKLSMEVCEETWVCGTDFVHWSLHSSYRRDAPASTEVKTEPTVHVAEGPEANEDSSVHAAANVAEEEQPELPLPPTEAPATSSKVKQESPATGLLYEPMYEPFVLKRCKSEPLRSSAKLAPDACFWKVDRHRPIGAVGF